MDNTNSTFDIEVSKKSETKEKAIQYKKYDKSKQSKEIEASKKEEVKEVAEVAKQESENVTEETVKEETPKKKVLKEGWARGVIYSKWKTSAWVILENGRGLTIDNANKYSVGEKIEFELPQWYRNLEKK